MLNKDRFTKESEETLKSIQEIKASIEIIERGIIRAKENYEYENSLEQRFQLDAALFLYKKYLKNKIEILSDEDSRSRDFTSINIEGQSFKIALDKNWQASDFKDLFDAVNKVYEFSAVSRMVKSDDLPSYDRIQSDRRMRRSYRSGSLGHILEREGKLNVVKVQYNSPGEVEFLSLVAEHAPSIIQTVLVSFALVKYAPNLCKELPRIYRTWVQEKVRARELRRQDKRNELLHDFFVRTFPRVMEENLLPALIDEAQQREVEGLLATISNNIEQVSDSELTDSINNTQDLFKAYSQMASMYLNGQINFPDDI